MFKPITISKANDFCAGLRRLKPSADGLVRLVFVEVRLDEKEPELARYMGLKLHADANGTIVPAHSAGAFEPDNEERSMRAMRNRRNDIVRWNLTPTEHDALTKAIRERLGLGVAVEVID
jgi:hypothetical protein